MNPFCFSYLTVFAHITVGDVDYKWPDCILKNVTPLGVFNLSKTQTSTAGKSENISASLEEIYELVWGRHGDQKTGTICRCQDLWKISGKGRSYVY